MQRGLGWHHITFTTYGAWLPGDRRGFRARDHKIHSSGSYKNPPPPQEHAGLRRYAAKISGDAVVLPADLRPVVGQAFVDGFAAEGLPLLVASVGAQHVHLHGALPAYEPKAAVGEQKRRISHALRDRLPGRIWAYGCAIEPIGDEEHQRNTFRYVRAHTAQGHWVWTFREGALPYLQE